LEYYIKYFQVSQDQVIERFTLALYPLKKTFMEKIRPNADFYGPYWILTTIIFLLGCASNLSRFIYNIANDEIPTDQSLFKLELVRYAVITIYLFGIGVPAALYFAINFLDSTIGISLPEVYYLILS
jgi:hypothetical protein